MAQVARVLVLVVLERRPSVSKSFMRGRTSTSLATSFPNVVQRSLKWRAKMLEKKQPFYQNNRAKGRLNLDLEAHSCYVVQQNPSYDNTLSFEHLGRMLQPVRRTHKSSLKSVSTAQDIKVFV